MKLWTAIAVLVLCVTGVGAVIAGGLLLLWWAWERWASNQLNPYEASKTPSR